MRVTLLVTLRVTFLYGIVRLRGGYLARYLDDIICVSGGVTLRVTFGFTIRYYSRLRRCNLACYLACYHIGIAHRVEFSCFGRTN